MPVHRAYSSYCPTLSRRDVRNQSYRSGIAIMSATLSQTPTASVADAPVDQEPTVHETVIAPKRGWIAVDWGELGRHRELLYFLVQRDLKVRYKQAVLGAVWAILQPLTQVIIFSLIFGAGFNLGSR